MSDFMILDAEHKLVPATVEEWGMFFDNGAARTVAKTEVGEARVSTVFLGLDHGYGGPPLWFETMIFGGPHDDFTDRYTTWAEAAAGHARVVAALTEGREP